MFRRSYATLWLNGSGPPLAGRIVLGPTALTVEGAGARREAARTVAYADIERLRLARAPHDRLGGRTSLLIGLHDSTTVQVAPAEIGALHELLEALEDRIKERTP